MRLVLLTIASAKEVWSTKASELYSQKISAFYKFEHLNLSPSKNSREQSSQKIKEETEILLGQIKPDDFVILFDERGDALTSKEFSKKLESVFAGGKKRCVFVIGGAFGVGESLKKRSDLVLSLGPFTMNHLLAQTVVLEQIYRALTIQKNLPYHNE